MLLILTGHIEVPVQITVCTFYYDEDNERFKNEMNIHFHLETKIV